jgi:hypothetical protein
VEAGSALDQQAPTEDSLNGPRSEADHRGPALRFFGGGCWSWRTDHARSDKKEEHLFAKKETSCYTCYYSFLTPIA